MAIKSKTRQLAYWEGDFGDSYIDRNSNPSLFKKRTKFFKKILTDRNIESVLEIGCNIGENLKVIHHLNDQIKITGLEPNKKAVKLARKNNLSAKIIHSNVFDLKAKKKYDLVFTSGVLIHISDVNITQAIKNIYNASKRYVLAIEYYSPKSTNVIYRGFYDALFKRPYKKLYITLFPDLKLIDSGRLEKNQGFDNCRFYLFEKYPKSK